MNNVNQLEQTGKYINKTIQFNYENGCIPANSLCFCYSVVGDYYWVHFREPILGMLNVKLHKEVIEKHGRIINQPIQ